MSLPPTLASMDAPLAFATLAVLKATILFALAGAAALILRRRSAALRHLVWALALGGAVALPLVMAFSPVSLPLFPAPQFADGVEDGAQTREGTEGVGIADVLSPPQAPAAALERNPDASSTDVSSTDVSSTDVSSTAGSIAQSGSTFPTRTAVLGLWLIGALLLLARFIAGVVRVRGIVNRSLPIEDEVWIATTQQVRNDRAPDAFEMRLSEEVDMPFAAGLVTPTIVIPASSTDWSPERREAVLLHELAHLSRGDLLMNALSHLARALYWFHPLAWYASHRLRIEGERACDDAVLRRGALASDYADHLLSIASAGTAGVAVPTAALAMARPSAFEGRLLAILEPGIERAQPSRLRVAATIAGFLVLILPLAAASPTARAAALAPVQEPAGVSPGEPGVRASAAVPALVEALSDANASVRLAAVNSLGALEDPRAIAALGKALREDSDPRVRQAAAEALGEIDDPRALPHLLEALRTERVSGVREQIVHALGEIDDPSAVPGIAALSKDPDVRVRRAVAAALDEFEDQSALPAMIAMARDDDAEVRRHVAEALGNLKGAAAVDALIALARDTDAEVRGSAVDAMGSLEDARVLGALVAALKDANVEVRRQAADAIESVPDLGTAPKALIDALLDPDKEVRRNVAEALGDIGDEAAVPALRRTLADSNAEVRRAVAEALSEIGGAEAITALMGLLKDPDPEIRRIAAEALGKRR